MTKAAAFESPAVKSIVANSCDDCHSNLTKWPWYTNVAPSSWLAQDDVQGGREVMNLSEWDKPQPELDEIVEAIEGGEMPPLKYKVMPNHANARLLDAEKQRLVEGFRRLYATQPPVVGGGGWALALRSRSATLRAWRRSRSASSGTTSRTCCAAPRPASA